MDEIGKQRIWSFFDGAKYCRAADNTSIRKGPGHKVRDFLDLAVKLAELQFRNQDYVLLFRGQGRDHKNAQHNTSLKPSLFRPQGPGNPNSSVLIERFRKLEAAEKILIERYRFLGVERLRRHRILRWSILQHYEVCSTPLLDVTHSARIAASFASQGATGRAYFYVIGVPNLSGAVTANAEAGLQIVRLSSVCPPSAVRPHIQEGYLLGEYPDMTGYDQKANYFPYEIDFGRRLVAKFWFNPSTFWKDDNFPAVSQSALYPSERNDQIFAFAREVQEEMKLRLGEAVQQPRQRIRPSRRGRPRPRRAK